MDLFLKVVEKLLFSLLSSIVLFIAAFSLMTGKFPPKGSDLIKVVDITKNLYFSNQEARALEKNFATMEPSLEQLAQLQRVALKRTEHAISLSRILVRFPKGIPSVPLAEKIDSIHLQLESVGTDIDLLRSEIQAATMQNSQRNSNESGGDL
jgi:hypothetical protein